MSYTRGKREARRGDSRQDAGYYGDPKQKHTAARTTTTARKAPKKSRKPKKGRGRLVLVLVAAVALVLVIGKLFVRPPDVSESEKPDVTDPKGTVSVLSSGGRKDDYYTFLLIGRDTGGGGNTDTLILVSYDVPNGQVNMMSIPRDTVVNVAWSTKKINSIYNVSEEKGGGLENLKKHVSQLTGVMPDRYVIIEWEAVGEIVEAVNGVEFDVPRNMNYDDPYQNLHIHLNKGLQTLNGQQAMQLLRYRHDNNASVGYNDTGRMATQQAFLKAMAKKVLKLGNITKAGDFLKIFMDRVETDLTLGELTWFATKAFGNADADNIQTWTMPYEDLGSWRGAWYLMGVPDQIAPLVNEYFNPYNREITVDDLQIVQRNSDGSCYVTNGTLADSKWAKAVGGSASTFGGGQTNTGGGTGVTAPSGGSGSSTGSGSGGKTGSSSGSSSKTGTTGGSTDAGTAGGSGSTAPEGSGGSTAEPADPDPQPSTPETVDPGPGSGGGSGEPGEVESGGADTGETETGTTDPSGGSGGEDDPLPPPAPDDPEAARHNGGGTTEIE